MTGEFEPKYVLVRKSEMAGNGSAPSDSDNQARSRVSEVLTALRKRRLLILITAGLFIFAALIVTVLTTPIYEAEATIVINREEESNVVDGSGTTPVFVGDSQYIATQIGLMESRSLSERVARRVDLIGQPGYGNSVESAAAGVRARMDVIPPVEGRLVDIRYQSENPELAAQAANAIAQEFITSNIERQFSDTSYARDFLEERIAATKDRLESAERQLANYARAAGIINLATGEDAGSASSTVANSAAANELRSLSEALSEAETEAATLGAIAAQARNGPVGATVADPTIQSLRQQRARLEAEYQDRLSVFKPDYPPMQQLQTQIDQIDRSIQRESNAVSAAAQNDYRAAEARAAELRNKVEGLKSELLTLNDRAIQYGILKREVDTTQVVYDSLLQRYKEITVENGIGSNQISIIDRAEVPGSPVKPNPILNLMAALILGLGVGVLTALILEFLDDVIRQPSDIIEKLRLNLIGVVPAAKSAENIEGQIAVASSELAEAYASARTSVLFAAQKQDLRSFLLTSTRANEGKSTSAMALASQFARAGFRTLLIDSDMRKPSRFTEEGNPGLSDLLIGNRTMEQVTEPAHTENLSIIGSGEQPANPAELLTSNAMREVMQKARENYEYVIIDSPPVMGLADAPLLASMADGVVFVIESEGARTGIVRGALERLRLAGANVMGGLLTKQRLDQSDYGYGYGYSYSYGETRREPKGGLAGFIHRLQGGN